MESKNRRMQKRDAMKRYWLIVGSVVVVFAILTAAIVFAYMTLATGERGRPAEENLLVGGQTDPDSTQKPTEEDETSKIPTRTTAMVLGLDEGGFLADVQLLVTYDAVSNQVDIISIPRDTYVDLPRDEVQAIQESGRYCPNNGIMKITELHSYAGKENGAAFAQRQLERMFDVEIDYFAVINVKAFRTIVDDVGGIWFEVRPEGYYYNPPDQVLNIHVPGGMRKLSGVEAEGVVRFRDGPNGYANGDLGRISVQQAFMQAFFTQALSRDTLADSLPALFAALVNDVKTNFGLDSLLTYLPVVETLSGDNIHFHQVPGAGQYVGVVSYFVVDEQKFAEQKADIFGGVTKEADLRIQLLNGGAAVGVTAQVHEALTNAGYNIVDMGIYNGAEKAYTRIQVREKANGEALAEQFSSAVVEVDEALPEEYDVVIILGQNESADE